MSFQIHCVLGGTTSRRRTACRKLDGIVSHPFGWHIAGLLWVLSISALGCGSKDGSSQTDTSAVSTSSNSIAGHVIVAGGSRSQGSGILNQSTTGEAVSARVQTASGLMHIGGVQGVISTQ